MQCCNVLDANIAASCDEPPMGTPLDDARTVTDDINATLSTGGLHLTVDVDPETSDLSVSEHCKRR